MSEKLPADPTPASPDKGEGAPNAAIDLPRLLTRAEALFARLETTAATGIELSRETIEAIVAAEARQTRWGRRALWAIALLLALALWLR